MKYLSYCLPLALLIFPTLNYAQPIDNQPYPYYFQFNPVDLNSARVVSQGYDEFSNCATGVACPYVYISSTGQPEDYQFVGEVLRNIIGKSKETEQELVLPVKADGQGIVHIRIAEEKSEITYLDAAWLSVDGRRVAPDNCAGDSDLAYCASDEHYHVMEFGDAIELKFSVGELAANSKLELPARGYYLPQLSLREQ